MTAELTTATTKLALVCSETTNESNDDHDNEAIDNDNETNDENESNDGINGNENSTEDSGWWDTRSVELVEVTNAVEQPASSTLDPSATVSIYPSVNAEETDQLAAIGEKRKRSEVTQSTQVTISAATLIVNENKDIGENSEDPEDSVHDITGSNGDERPTKRRDIILNNRFEAVREKFSQISHPEDRKAAEEKILKMAEDVNELTTLMSEKRALHCENTDLIRKHKLELKTQKQELTAAFDVETKSLQAECKESKDRVAELESKLAQVKEALLDETMRHRKELAYMDDKWNAQQKNIRGLLDKPDRIEFEKELAVPVAP